MKETKEIPGSWDAFSSRLIEQWEQIPQVSKIILFLVVLFAVSMLLPHNRRHRHDNDSIIDFGGDSGGGD